MPGIQSSLNKSHCSPPVRPSNRECKAICTAEAADDETCCLCTAGHACTYFYQVNSRRQEAEAKLVFKCL